MHMQFYCPWISQAPEHHLAVLDHEAGKQDARERGPPADHRAGSPLHYLHHHLRAVSSPVRLTHSEQQPCAYPVFWMPACKPALRHDLACAAMQEGWSAPVLRLPA